MVVTALDLDARPATAVLIVAAFVAGALVLQYRIVEGHWPVLRAGPGSRRVPRPTDPWLALGYDLGYRAADGSDAAGRPALHGCHCAAGGGDTAIYTVQPDASPPGPPGPWTEMSMDCWAAGLEPGFRLIVVPRGTEADGTSDARPEPTPTGDPEFDRTLLAYGEPAQLVRSFLGVEERACLLRMTPPGVLRADWLELRFAVPGDEVRPDRWKRVAESLVDLHASLARLGQSAAPGKSSIETR